MTFFVPNIPIRGFNNSSPTTKHYAKIPLKCSFVYLNDL